MKKQKSKKTKIFLSILALAEVVVLAAGITFSWMEGGNRGYINGKDIQISTGSGLTMIKDGIRTNTISLEPCELAETSSSDGRNFFFPMADTDSHITSDMTFREGTASDRNQKYISMDFQLVAGSSATEVYLGAGTIIQCDNEELLSALRMSFSANDGSTPVVFKPNQMPGINRSFSPITSIDNDGKASQTSTSTKAFGDYYFDGSNKPSLFRISEGETKNITLSIWLEGTEFTDNDVAEKDLSIYIDFTTKVDDLVKYNFVDNTHGYGENEAYYLVGTINGSDYACQTDSNRLGKYRFNSNNQLTVQFTADSYVFVKNGKNDTYYMTTSFDSFANSATLKKTNDGGKDKLYVPANKKVTFTLVDNGNGTLNLSYDDAAPDAKVIRATTSDDLYYDDTTFCNTEYWITNKEFNNSYDTMMYVYDKTTERYYAMTKSSNYDNDHTWIIYVPDSVKNFLFRRYSVDINKTWNEWAPSMTNIPKDSNGQFTYVAICGKSLFNTDTSANGPCGGYWKDSAGSYRIYFEKSNTNWNSDNIFCYTYDSSENSISSYKMTKSHKSNNHNVYYIDLKEQDKIAKIKFGDGSNYTDVLNNKAYLFNGFTYYYESSSIKGGYIYTGTKNSKIFSN